MRTFLLPSANEREKRLLFDFKGGESQGGAEQPEVGAPPESPESTDTDPKANANTAAVQAAKEAAAAQAQILGLGVPGALAGNMSATVTAQNLENALNGKETEPEKQEEPPQTNGERIDRDMQKAQDTLNDPNKKGWEKMGAAITFILLIIERIKMQMAGTLEDPPKDVKNETAATPAEGAATPQNGTEAPAESQKRLNEEVAKHTLGIDGVLKEKDDKLNTEINNNDSEIQSVNKELTASKEHQNFLEKHISDRKNQLTIIDNDLNNPALPAEERENLQSVKTEINRQIISLEVDARLNKQRTSEVKVRLKSLIATKGTKEAQVLQDEINTLRDMKIEALMMRDKLNVGLIRAAQEISTQLGDTVPFLQNLQHKLSVELDLNTLKPYVHVEDSLKGDLTTYVQNNMESSSGGKQLNEDLADGKINDVEALTKVLEKLHKEAKPAA